MLLKRIKELNQELVRTEARCVSHFRKLTDIEEIIEDADKNNELYCNTLKKIKIVLSNPARYE